MELILNKFLHIFGKSKKKDLSSFFLYASKKEQRRVFLDVIDKANKDQKSLVESIDKKI